MVILRNASKARPGARSCLHLIQLLLLCCSLNRAFSATELPGPSSRRTAITISEIMYHPFAGAPEFVELHNSSPWPEDISGYQLTGDISFIFPSGTFLVPNGYLVVPGNYQIFATVYGTSNVVIGFFGGTLPNDQGTVRLKDRAGAILLEVTYGTEPPWPLLPDGRGYSLVLARPSLGEADPRAWDSSKNLRGSPGFPEPVSGDPLRSVVINELLANSALPDLDFIELYNRGTQDVDLAGCSLSNDPDTNKFIFEGSIILPTGGYLALDESPWSLGFRLKAEGDTLYLRGPTNAILDVVPYGPQLNGVSLGRVPEGGPEFYPLSPSTPFARNDTLLSTNIVINEIMYAPISGSSDDEYVELYNRSTNAVNVGGWAFVDGISFTNPPNTIIPAQGYLVLAKNKTNLLAKYPQLSDSNTIGNFSGSLAGDGERIAIGRPQTNINNGLISVVYAVVDEVTYGTGGRWGQWSHQGGSSLELIDARSENRLAANWADSDETAKAPWTTVEFTGTLDNGTAISTGALQILLLEAGECLVDNVEVFVQGGANLVPNGSFESGLANWLLQGNHERSELASEGFAGSAHSLRLRASGPGDTGPNHAEIKLPVALTNGTATIRAQVRWLRGHPDILFRLAGNYLEAVGHMSLPENLGTPGLANSRLLQNSGPAIFNVRHEPALPADGEPVIVTAQVHDPDGISSLQLRYRVDPGLNFIAVPMVDDGTGGDKRAGDALFSAAIPGQSAGTLVAFYVQASDGFVPPATNRFPNDAPQRECLIRFGEPTAAGNFGAYHLWLTSSNLARWAARGPYSDEPLDCTFADGGGRTIYNAAVRYGGEQASRGNFVSPTTSPASLVIEFPADDRLLGSDELVLDPVESSADGTALRELTVFWMAEQLGLPGNHDRLAKLFINGVRPAFPAVPIYIDREVPNSSYLVSRFNSDSSPELFEVSNWLEYSDGGILTTNGADLLRRVTTGGVKKQARYRWNWRKRQASNETLDDDYRDLFSLVESVNSPDITYLSEVTNAISPEWINALAFRHAVGDWQGYGYSSGENQFAYKAFGQPWKMLFNRFRYAFGAGDLPGADLFQTTEPMMARLFSQPDLRRRYLRSLERAANGPFISPLVEPMLDARYQALVADGISVGSLAPMKDWISQRRAFILSQLPVTPFSLTIATNLTVSNNLLRITGTGDLSMDYVRVYNSALGSSADFYPTWLTPTNWVISVILNPGANTLSLAPNISAQGILILVFNQGAICPVTPGAIAINEIMYNPSVPASSYVELYNPSPTCSFDLSNWRLDGAGLTLTFPSHTILTNGGYLVLAANRSAFVSAYGAGIPIAGEFSGDLNRNGQGLSLVIPARSGLPISDFDQVVDRVRYESGLPWPVGSNGVPTAASIQLVDPKQDHSRPCNWFTSYVPPVWSPATNIVGYTNAGWQHVEYVGIIQGSTNPALQGTNLLIFLDRPGEVFIDDIVLSTDDISSGTNLIQNGGFESMLNGPWVALGNDSNSVIASSFSHSGDASLHLVASGSGGANSAVRQYIPGAASNLTCTLSFWFYASTNAANLTVRTFPGSQFILTTNVQQVLVPNQYFPPQLISTGLASVTPGGPNAGTTTINPPIPPLWLNEVQTLNTSNIADHAGEYDPWIELYNSGSNDIALAGYYLSTDYSNLTRWPFPPGAFLGAGEFKVIFADGETNQTTASEWHTSFRLTEVSGSVALSRSVAGQMKVFDYLNYPGLKPSRSYGALPDGQLFNRIVLPVASPGASNPPPPIFINEWMARNSSTVRDPADNDFDDWFELYNATDDPVDLSGYYLVSGSTFWSIPGGTLISGKGFLLVWADGEANQNRSDRIDLHTPFKLSRTGDSITLLSPTRNPVDSISFRSQSKNVSEGRWPDGARCSFILRRPTPRVSNVLSNALPPILAFPDQIITFGQASSFGLSADDPEAPLRTPLQFHLEPGAPTGAAVLSGSSPACDGYYGYFSWTPTSAQAPSTNLITVSVTDNGVPPLSSTNSFKVIVQLPIPRVSPISAPKNGTVTITVPTVQGRIYGLFYKDRLDEPSWIPVLPTVFSDFTSLVFTNSIGTNQQRFYRVAIY